MAEACSGLLDQLRALEAPIRSLVPRCTFYFGAEDEHRDAAPPLVIWKVIEGGPAQDNTQRRAAVSGRTDPRPFATDEIEVAAICYGERSNTTEPRPREAEYAASEHLMSVVRWCLKSGAATGHLGAHRLIGWKPLLPTSPGERGCPIEVRFALQMQLLAPVVQHADPPLTTSFFPPVITS